ncbi:MAG: DUF424 family protein [Candidatus Aenigmarchaeota archaeon]|jgi:hypothetical protein|nr:DUF424 family protein [Candidatus Aenigmarchaeota archaeon]
MPSNKFWSRLIKTRFETLVAICDEELIGKEIKIEKNFSTSVSERFYKEKLIDEKEALDLMEKATIGNLLGERIIKLAIEKNIISPEGVILIGGIPHAQFVKI